MTAFSPWYAREREMAALDAVQRLFQASLNASRGFRRNTRARGRLLRSVNVSAPGPAGWSSKSKFLRSVKAGREEADANMVDLSTFLDLEAANFHVCAAVMMTRNVPCDRGDS